MCIPTLLTDFNPACKLTRTWPHVLHRVMAVQGPPVRYVTSRRVCTAYTKKSTEKIETPFPSLLTQSSADPSTSWGCRAAAQHTSRAPHAAHPRGTCRKSVHRRTSPPGAMCIDTRGTRTLRGTPLSLSQFGKGPSIPFMPVLVTCHQGTTLVRTGNPPEGPGARLTPGSQAPITGSTIHT